MRAAHVADVRHRCAAVLRRAGHAPARHHELALAVVAGAHDRRHLIGEDARKEREVARAVMPGTKPIADRRLAFGQAVEVAHAAEVCSHKAKSQRRQEPMPRLRSSLKALPERRVDAWSFGERNRRSAVRLRGAAQEGLRTLRVRRVALRVPNLAVRQIGAACSPGEGALWGHR
jgi:hypothetical protein